jgi:hypothetical protein
MFRERTVLEETTGMSLAVDETSYVCLEWKSKRLEGAENKGHSVGVGSRKTR